MPRKKKIVMSEEALKKAENIDPSLKVQNIKDKVARGETITTDEWMYVCQHGGF